jgi:hypothetical protein
MVTLYWLGILVTIPFWLFVFLRLRSERKYIILGGLLVAPLGVLWDVLMWQRDWWVPEVTTPYGIVEGFVYGFFFFGFAALCYEAVLGRPVKYGNWRFKELLLIIGAMTSVSLILFYTTDIRSVPLTITMGIALTVYLLFRKPQMTYHVLASTIIVLIYALVGYSLLGTLVPGLLNQWQMVRLSGIVFLSAPIEDLIFYLVCGAMAAAIYRFIRLE